MSKVFGTIVNPNGDIVGCGYFDVYETHRGNMRLRSGTTSFPFGWLRLNMEDDKKIRCEYEQNKDNCD